MKRSIIALTTITTFFTACTEKKDFDASGNFEADEVIVSAQQNGNLLSFPISEGQQLKAGEKVGQLDVHYIELQKQQAEATIAALHQKTSDPNSENELVKRQLSVQQVQLDQQIHERERTIRLIKADAATRKQLDDINAKIKEIERQMEVNQQQIKVNIANNSTQNKSILSEKEPLVKSTAQYEDQIKKGEVINPINGTVLVKYALAGEMEVTGRALYKIANTDTLYLRAYVTGTQLPEIKNGQAVTVRIDQGNKNYKNYSGTISWISEKSEFTPKTIQTKEERANLVYAIKVCVKNDGFLKIGMYGEVIFSK